MSCFFLFLSFFAFQECIRLGHADDLWRTRRHFRSIIILNGLAVISNHQIHQANDIPIPLYLFLSWLFLRYLNQAWIIPNQKVRELRSVYICFDVFVLFLKSFYAHLYDIKYFYQIRIVHIELYGFNYSYLMVIWYQENISF